jgi:hypothetical protein
LWRNSRTMSTSRRNGHEVTSIRFSKVCFKATHYLAGHSVRPAYLVAPVSSSYRYHWQLGQDDSTSNCCCHFFGTLHTQANVSIWVTNSCKKKKKINKPCNWLSKQLHPIKI